MNLGTRIYRGILTSKSRCMGEMEAFGILDTSYKWQAPPSAPTSIRIFTAVPMWLYRCKSLLNGYNFVWVVWNTREYFGTPHCDCQGTVEGYNVYAGRLAQYLEYVINHQTSDTIRNKGPRNLCSMKGVKFIVYVL